MSASGSVLSGSRKWRQPQSKQYCFLISLLALESHGNSVCLPHWPVACMAQKQTHKHAGHLDAAAGQQKYREQKDAVNGGCASSCKRVAQRRLSVPKSRCNWRTSERDSGGFRSAGHRGPWLEKKGRGLNNQRQDDEQLCLWCVRFFRDYSWCCSVKVFKVYSLKACEKIKIQYKLQLFASDCKETKG